MPQDDSCNSAVPWGHSENDHGEPEPLARHLRAVAARSAEFAAAFGCEEEGRTCGLLHDLGKLGKPAQRRIREGKGRGVDHWSFGAHQTLARYRTEGVAAALCILAHHQGLAKPDEVTLNKLFALTPLRESLRQVGKVLSEVPSPEADVWLASGNMTPHESIASVCPGPRLAAQQQADAMTDLRMLFSALVDADFLETEAHFRAPAPGQRYERPQAPELSPRRALARVLAYIDRCRQHCRATEHVIEMRDDLLAACQAAAGGPQGVFTLSAPTGTGKTLAMLTFALEHAARHDLRRVVLVVPYLSIIEQTARIYRTVFGAHDPQFGPHFVLEHHSLTIGPSEEDSPEENQRLATARLLTENWDAPVIITTSVQFFESLFSNRPSACRKLHRLARSVVLFDEVQTFPKQLAIPTLAALSQLSRRHGCTTVFATATQPAFVHFDENVKQIGGPGWRPREIVSADLNLFDRARRTTVHWPKTDQEIGWNALAHQLAGDDDDRVLCIVNLKRHAMRLVEFLIEAAGRDGLFHLSTNLCPAHRVKVLGEVRQRLDDRSAGPCRLIATQCVEAGVDLDFPTVYRAMGPLDGIAQAAGRCNRNGRLHRGDVYVFRPDPMEDGNSRTLYPPGGYCQAAAQTESLLSMRGAIDLDDPVAFERYYHNLYQLDDFMHSEVIEAVLDLDFEKVADLYRLIDNRRTVNLVVPYDRKLFDGLYDRAQEQGLSREWIRRARPLAVAIYGTADSLGGCLEPVPLPRWDCRHHDTNDSGNSDEWFFLRDDTGDCYDADLLGLKGLPSAWIA